ncbi:hypothetical protein LguiB_012884 [Lonicera macranthoides]
MARVLAKSLNGTQTERVQAMELKSMALEAIEKGGSSYKALDGLVKEACTTHHVSCHDKNCLPRHMMYRAMTKIVSHDTSCVVAGVLLCPDTSCVGRAKKLSGWPEVNPMQASQHYEQYRDSYYILTRHPLSIQGEGFSTTPKQQISNGRFILSVTH